MKTKPQSIAECGISILGKKDDLQMKIVFELNAEDIRRINKRIREGVKLNEERRAAGDQYMLTHPIIVSEPE